MGDGRFNGTMQNVVGPTFVAMAPTFGLGAEIQSPTGMSICLSVTNFKLLLFLFLDGIEPFWPSILLYKTFSPISDLGPLTPKIYSPKFAQNRL